MFGTTFYHGTLKKYVILFGTLFNDIWITRADSAGNIKQTQKVPLTYSPRDKFIARIKDNPDLQKEFAIILPRMGFEFLSFTYAPERKLPTINKFVTQTGASGDRKKYQYNPVPYDIGFQLTVMVKNVEDGTMIIEQILPYFTPEWTTTVQLIEDPNITLDIPLILNGITSEDIYEGAYEERRSIVWTLDFVMKGYIFGPTKRQGIIKLANVNFYDSTIFDDIGDSIGNTDPVVRITTYPGQDANGNPTTDANLAISNTASIAEGDEWDYVTVIEDPLSEA